MIGCASPAHEMVKTAIGRWLSPLVLLGLLWGVVAKGDAASWVVGLPSIALAAVAFDRLRGQRTLGFRPWMLPEFAAWFLWHSLRGGADVAWRALQPQMPLHPGFLRYRLALPPGSARVFLVDCLSLLPGTLSADIEGDELVLHALDTGADVIAETREAERRVEKLYGISGGPTRG